MNIWIELDDTYLTNQPMIWAGRGRGHKRIPDPSVKPTEAYLFTHECRQTKRGVKRRRTLVTLQGKDAHDLERQIETFVMRKDVRLRDTSTESQHG